MTPPRSMEDPDVAGDGQSGRDQAERPPDLHEQHTGTAPDRGAAGAVRCGVSSPRGGGAISVLPAYGWTIPPPITTGK